LMRYLVPAAEKVLCGSQSGFRPARNTIQQCYALNEIMCANTNAVHAFLDIKAAYDCVNRRLLWRDMAQYGFEEHMIAVCQALTTMLRGITPRSTAWVRNVGPKKMTEMDCFAPTFLPRRLGITGRSTACV